MNDARFCLTRSEFTYCCNLDKNVSTSHPVSGARGHKVPATDHFFPQDVIIHLVYICNDFTVPLPHSTVSEANRLCSLSFPTTSGLK